jgi:hypothetical protein
MSDTPAHILAVACPDPRCRVAAGAECTAIPEGFGWHTARREAADGCPGFAPREAPTEEPKARTAEMIERGKARVVEIRAWLGESVEAPTEWGALDGLESAGVAHDHAEHVRATWRELQGVAGPIPLPRVTLDDTVKLAWSTDALYAEIEIYADGTRAWFARNRRTNAHAGSGDVSQLPLDPWLCAALAALNPEPTNG